MTESKLIWDLAGIFTSLLNLVLLTDYLFIQLKEKKSKRKEEKEEASQNAES